MTKVNVQWTQVLKFKTKNTRNYKKLAIKD